MKDYTSNTPEFSEHIQTLETSDPGHADNVNVATTQLLQNTLRNQMEIRMLNAVSVYLESVLGARITIPKLVTADGRSFVTVQGKTYRAVRARTYGDGGILEEVGHLKEATEDLNEVSEHLRGTIEKQEATISRLSEMLKTGNVLVGLTTTEGARFVYTDGNEYKALKILQFK